MHISKPDMYEDQYYMELALLEAGRALKADEVPVGAVVVDCDGNVIGTGFNRPVTMNDPTSHAEIEALRAACQKTRNYRQVNTSMYVTIEPCIMCMGAIIHARIKRLVFGASDPKWGAAGSLYNFSTDSRLNHRLEIRSGVMEQEARQMIQGFFRNKRSNSWQIQ